MRKSHFRIKKLILVLGLVLCCTSCGSRKEVAYFQNAKDFETQVMTDSFNSRFKVNDLVSINVSALDMELVRPFNLYRPTGEFGRPEEVDYLIDKEGNIDFPVLGKIRLLGLTIQETKDLFREKLVPRYLKEPIINIRIKNFRITVLGEVNRPGTYPISGERITILEALGLAGDLTIKGVRQNILVIRDFNGVKTYSRVDLTTKEFINSPVYYLTQNDIVYVEPNKSAVSSSKFDGRISAGISIASILITSTILLLTR